MCPGYHIPNQEQVKKKRIWLDFLPRSAYLKGVGKKRLDVLLVEREMAESRGQAQALILAGDVEVNGSRIDRAGALVAEDAEIGLIAPLKYVGRGGFKLEGALVEFGIDPRGRVCADIGASTGGFTDCLLQRGVSRVYAIDVGYGQIAWKLRLDPRVVVMDRVNVRFLEGLPEPIDLAVVDVSFISLTLVLAPIRRLLRPEGEMIALIKPPFEAGRNQVGKGGIVRDPAVHRSVIHKVAGHAQGLGLRVLGLCRSPIYGADGNAEFFIRLSGSTQKQSIDVEQGIDRAIAKPLD